MKKIHTFIALYFNLSRKEANGFIILVLLIPVFILLPWLVRLCYSSHESISSKDQQSLNQFVAQLEAELSSKREKVIIYRGRESNPQASFHEFDPNKDNEEQMKLAGLPSSVAARIVKFRSKGGIFKKKEDLKKIYGLSDSVYEQVYPYINIQTFDQKSAVAIQKLKREVHPFDLNLVDSTALVALKGIGPTLSARIIKYRNKLGGFIALHQLTEIYGLDSLALQELNQYGYIDKGFIPKKIELNSREEKIFLQHPYLGKKLTNIIFQYRFQHGDFTSTEQLYNIKSIPKETILKILPYLQ